MTIATTSNKFLTLGEAAKTLGVSRRTVRRYISAGLLEAVRLGSKTVRVRATSLDELTSSNPIGNPRREQ